MLMRKLPLITDTDRIIIRDEFSCDIVPHVWRNGRVIKTLLPVPPACVHARCLAFDEDTLIYEVAPFPNSGIGRLIRVALWQNRRTRVMQAQRRRRIILFG